MIESLNEAYRYFIIEEIESRLETDALTLGGLFDLGEENLDMQMSKSCFMNGSCVCDGHDDGCVLKMSCVAKSKD